MYKMIPFEEAQKKLVNELVGDGHGEKECLELTNNGKSVLAVRKDRWDAIIQGYMIDPDPVVAGSMSVYKIFPVDKNLDMIQLPDFLLEKL